MSMLLALLAAATFIPPAEPLTDELRAAIWHDLQVNALIGNGNWVGSLWYQAGSETTPNLHVQDLRCRSKDERKLCSFTLLRDGGVATVFDEEAPDKLSCDATFVSTKDKEGWAVKHIPPRRSGHSRTTMRCKPASS